MGVLSRRFGPNTSALVLLAITAGSALVFYVAKRAEGLENSFEQKSIAAVTEYATGAVIETSSGSIEISFLSKDAPKTVRNFIKLAEGGFYNSTKFHRVIPDFMIQGGDPLTKDDTKKDFWGTGGPGYEFDDEQNSVRLISGIVAMANRGPNTNGSQFFIITAPETPWLEGKHTPFARVVRGMDVANRVSRSPRDGRDIPREPVLINNVILK